VILRNTATLYPVNVLRLLGIIAENANRIVIVVVMEMYASTSVRKGISVE